MDELAHVQWSIENFRFEVSGYVLMKTVSVALVMCLNVGVDPPDVVKTSPCARQECWIDPLNLSPQKALEAIGANLQKQYERWQPRARYKQSLDPTVEEVKKLCTSLRRNAKEERVLFHYNGHGVPKPTINGEIWVFNKSYTQYIPLSIYDLQTWMGSPSIYVYDCSSAGIIVDLFKQFSQQREQEVEASTGNGSPRLSDSSQPASVRHCIQLAACGPSEILPMNPELPADLFTSCLTTPIKIALKWYVLQNTGKLVPGLTQELVDKIPGQLTDRRTMLGELNWIFTAITDTIAWNALPRELFQKLFRQDLLVASLFRNFLLAERIMRSYNCTPVSGPKLPPTYQHPMWQAWDLALDLCLSQLPELLGNEATSFKHSPFFAEQLTAFQVWLKFGSESRSPPEQLPIVLQVLLSQVHRLRALDLLGRFLDLGPWAVSLALSVGIFPYVLKLLQSSAKELRPLLVFIWAKILAVDSSCQADLVKDSGHKYFLSVLSDPNMPPEHRTMAAFVLAMIVNDHQPGQEATLKGHVIDMCLEQLHDTNAQLRQWLALCLGKVWTNFPAARWCGVRDSAHEKLYPLLLDSIPEVRAAAVFALGTFFSNSTDKDDHAHNIDLGVGMTLVPIAQDGSPLVRKELAVAFGSLVTQFDTQFASVAAQMMEEDRNQLTSAVVTGIAPDSFFPPSNMKHSSSRTSIKGMMTSSGSSNALAPQMTNSASGSQDGLSSLEVSGERMRKVPSNPSLVSMIGFTNVFTSVWKALLQLSTDPHPEVVSLAKAIVKSVRLRAAMTAKPKHVQNCNTVSHSAPSSPSNKPSPGIHQGTPPQRTSTWGERDLGHSKDHTSSTRNNSLTALGPLVATQSSQYAYATQFSRSRKIFDKGPNLHKDPVYMRDDPDSSPVGPRPVVGRTEFFQWSCKHFAQPVMRVPEEQDRESESYHQQSFRFSRNARVRRQAREEHERAGFSRLDDQIFVNRNLGVPLVLKFHPHEYHLAVADKDRVSFWDWEAGTQISTLINDNPKHTKITSVEFLNSHDISLLMCGSDDGAVRVWRNYNSDNYQERELVTSFQALSDMLPSARGSGLVTDWEQNSRILLASGDVRIIRVWDTDKEQKIQDIITGADSCVTSLACETSGRSLIVAGCGDGTVRLYDRRLPSECRVMTLREHNGYVLKVHMKKGLDGNILSASVAGDVRFWDTRFTESVRTINLQQGLTAMEVHNYADVLACGSVNQYISVYSHSGECLSTIKYHEGFMGQRIGPISGLAFHPYKVKLAAGSMDSFISVYSMAARKY